MQHEFNASGTRFVLAGDRLRITQHGDLVLDVGLSPVFDGERVPLGGWELLTENHYRACLGKYGAAHLAPVHGRMGYWIETPVKQFETVTYLDDGVLSGEHWRTFISDDLDRTWHKSIDANVPVSSAYAVTVSPDGTSGGGMTDPDDIPVHFVWNVHVRACALKGRERWLGLSIPGPWGIGVTRFNMTRRRFHLRFEVLRPACTDGRMPVVYFCPNLADSADVLDEHRNLSVALGHMDLAPKQIPDWWSFPWQGFADEWYRHHHDGLITKGEGNILEYLPQWIEKTRQTTGIHDLNTNLEQGCFRLYGDYRPAENMSSEAEMRQTIDRWRTDGIRAGLYLHPFIVNTKVPFFKEHPDAFCQPKDPDFLMDYACEEWDPDPKFAPVDWTCEEGRTFMLDWVDYILSDKPGCMNFDILRSNHWRSPDPRAYNFHDPDWGIGDMMTYKVQKLLYERAKAIKPDCMVTKIACVDCYMQPTFDAMQICEEWTHSMEYWYRRTELATRLLRNTLVYTDPWFVTRTKWSEYYLSYLVCNVPECQAATHTTHCYYPSWRELGEKHFRRRKSGYQLYMHARQDPSDEMQMTWQDGEIEASRCRGTGPLAGWYAALALGRKGMVTYSETQALAAVSETRTAWLPLPPGSELNRVTRVPHEGAETDYEYDYDPIEHQVRLYLEDCGGDVLYYRIRYTLADA